MVMKFIDADETNRPEVLSGQTIKVRSPFGTVFVTVNEQEGRPVELFLNVGKCGSDVAADAEAIGRLCSLLLRMPSPMPGERRIELMIRSLTGIGGNGEVISGLKHIRSLPDAVAHALSLRTVSKTEPETSSESDSSSASNAA